MVLMRIIPALAAVSLLCVPDQRCVAANSDADVAKKEAAINIIRSHVSSRSGSSDLKDVVGEAKLLLSSAFGPSEVDEILVEAMVEAGEYKKPVPQDSLLEAAAEGYADKHILGMLDTIHDPDCMSREFDVTSSSYDPEEATNVLHKCKVLVLRNALPEEFLKDYKSDFAGFISGLHHGNVSPLGKTTNGENRFLHMLDPNRWEIVLPRFLAHSNIIANDYVMPLLQDNRILGEDLVLHSLGGVVSDSGGPAGRWHQDDEYLFGTSNSFETTGVGGHDLPGFAITMLVPMLNITHDHGPTEFCMGSSHLKGLAEKPKLKDKSLSSSKSEFRVMRKYQNQDSCPPAFWRTPILNMGDILLFDYIIDHRGGANLSDEMRSILYMTFSRSWYKDGNFRGRDKGLEDVEVGLDDIEEEGGSENNIEIELDEDLDEDTAELMEQLTDTARFAIPNFIRECEGEACNVKIETIKNFIAGDSAKSKESEILDNPDPVVFLLTNVDVEEGDPHLYIEGEPLGKLKVGTSFRVSASPGSHVEVRSSRGVLYREWTVLPDQVQLVLSNSMIKK